MSIYNISHQHQYRNTYVYLFELDDSELDYIYLVSNREDKPTLHKLWDILDSININKNQLLISKRRGAKNES